MSTQIELLPITLRDAQAQSLRQIASQQKHSLRLVNKHQVRANISQKHQGRRPKLRQLVTTHSEYQTNRGLIQVAGPQINARQGMQILATTLLQHHHSFTRSVSAKGITHPPSLRLNVLKGLTVNSQQRQPKANVNQEPPLQYEGGAHRTQQQVISHQHRQRLNDAQD